MLYVEAFFCLVALSIVIALSEIREPYKQGMLVTRGAPRGGECFMMMEWKILLSICVLQVNSAAVHGVACSTFVVSTSVIHVCV